jgi:hypothetical protein
MRIQRKAFKKWLFITALCGAHSFFWGFLSNASPLAMTLGILTLAAAFAAIESHRAYQAKRAAAPRLARALDSGVKFRCWFAVYTPLSTLAMMLDFVGPKAHYISAAAVLQLPYKIEVFIGACALWFTEMLTGGKLDTVRSQTSWASESGFIDSYLSTLFTGFLHTLILGLICIIAYGLIRLRTHNKPLEVDKDVIKQ